MVRRVKQGSEGETPIRWGGTQFAPLPPCGCGKPQLCAVIINGAKIPKCHDCYIEHWSPARISKPPTKTREPGSDDE